MVMNRETAECDVFGNKKAAEKNSSENTFIFPCDIVDDEEDAELLLYPNADKSAKLSYVAEYVAEDLSNDDLQDVGEDYPVKIALG